MSDSLGALQLALAAEHAAIFGYGVAGAHLTGAQLATARGVEATHRDRRDTLELRIQALKGNPIGAQPAYALPFAVTDAASAMHLAAVLEDAAAGAWREALGATDGEDRKTVLAALTDCAVQATRWRKTAGITPVTVPFPGTAS